MPVDAMSKMRCPTVLAQPLFSIEHIMVEQLTILSQHQIKWSRLNGVADALGKTIQMYNLLIQTMKPDDTIINHILDVIARAPGCPINHVPNSFHV